MFVLIATLVTLLSALPGLTTATLARKDEITLDNGVNLRFQGQNPPSIRWEGAGLIDGESVWVRPAHPSSSILDGWDYLNEAAQKWLPLKGRGEFQLVLQNNMGERTCYLGRTTNDIMNLATFRFQSSASYLDHCAKVGSDDQVYVRCGEPKGEIKATCIDWPLPSLI